MSKGLQWLRRVESPKVGEEGFYSLINEARFLYRKEVMQENKSYTRFVQDFIHSNKYHDALDAWSKNQHYCNHQRICELLTIHSELAIRYFEKESFLPADLKELVNLFNRSESYLVRAYGKRELTFDDSGSATLSSSTSIPLTPLSQDLIDLIVHFANEVNLFKEPVTHEHFRAFYSGSPLKPLTVLNNNNIVLFFTTLAEYNLISYKWQKIITTYGLITNDKSKRPVTVKSLHTTSCRLKNKTANAEHERFLTKLHHMIYEYKHKQIN